MKTNCRSHKTRDRSPDLPEAGGYQVSACGDRQQTGRCPQTLHLSWRWLPALSVRVPSTIRLPGQQVFRTLEPRGTVLGERGSPDAEPLTCVTLQTAPRPGPPPLLAWGSRAAS